jgi:hypothetical protein
MSAPERDTPRPVRLRERAEPMSGHSRSFKRGIAATGLVALLLTACATPERSAAPLPVLPPPTQAPEGPVPPCARPATTVLPLGMDGGQAADGADGRIRLHAITAAVPADRSLDLIATGTVCARSIIAVAAEPFGVLAVAAQLAAGEGLPLLVLPAGSQEHIGAGLSARSRAVIEQLGVEEVITFGPIPADGSLALPTGVELVDLLEVVPLRGPADSASAAARALAARWRVDVAEAAPADVEGFARAVAMGRRDRVLLFV